MSGIMIEHPTTEQIDSLQALHLAARRAVAAFEEDQVPFALSHIAQDSQRLVLEAAGYPEDWKVKLVRERRGTPIGRTTLRSTTVGALRRADIVTFEELAQRSPEQILELNGVGPVALRQLREELERRGLDFNVGGAA